MSKGYILGDREKAELERLAFQHRVWSEETESLYRRAGLTGAKRFLELGCGPGYTVMDMARRIEGAEEISGIDSSEFFINHLKKWVHENEVGQIYPVCADIHSIGLPSDYYDACFARWVLMFLPRIEEVIQKVYDSLKPGGVFAVMEYGPFSDISLNPPSEIFDTIFDAVRRLMIRWDGNPDIGLHLPEMLRDAGFSRVEAVSVSKKGRPGTDFWKWIEATSAHHDNLVDEGLISRADLQEYLELMDERSRDMDTVFTAPTMQQIVAYK